MVFSAPEITTVSKPKRNPASADVSDQKKMRPFIFEVELCLPKRWCHLQLNLDQVLESRTAFTLWSADILFLASRGCRRPSKSRWCSPSSADCQRPAQSGTRRRSKAP